MKAKVNLRKLVSYLLIFTFIFSMIQVGNEKVANAAIVSQIEGLSLRIGSSTGKEQSIDKNSKGEYIAELLPMSSMFTLVPSNGYKIKSVKSSNSSKMTIRGPISGNYTISTIKDYSDFILTVTMVNPDNSEVSYEIIMNFDTSAALEFSVMRVRLDNEDPIPLIFGETTDGEYRIPDVESTIKAATIELLDSANKPMTFKVNGGSSKKVNLVGGENIITITVTNSGISKDYTLVIDKKGEAKLKSLVPSTGKLSPVFNSEVYDYTVTVPATQESIAFTPTAVDNSSTIKVDGVNVKSGNKSSEIKLSEGENDIPITLKTKDGITTTYNVQVIRTEAFRSSQLKSLKLSKGTLNPAFNKGIYDYTATVENTVTSITVTPVAEDSNATITVNDKKLPSGATSPYINLDEGGNIINVEVTDSKGDSSTYTINVTRRYGKDNVNLSSLSVTDGTMSPKFDPETYLYSVKVARNIEKVRIKFTAQNDKATIKIGDKTYTNGQDSDYIKLDIGANLVIVEVTGEDKKATTTYKLSIIRGQVEGTNQWVLVSGNWTFYNGAGVQVKNQWVKYDNQWYFLDVNGYMKTGWLLESGNWYYLNANGIMQTGWFYEKGYWYYLEANGAMKINSWGQYDGKWYLFNSFGEMQTGWTLYGPYWYYMNEKGVMQKGWITYNKNKYYLNDDGSMRNGWLYTGSAWYYFDNAGVMKTGWQTINGKNYYFDANGVMKTGMLFLDGRWINLNNI